MMGKYIKIINTGVIESRVVNNILLKVTKLAQ